ncbi:MAG TPA: phosphodiester glycosidase family protein, partial [Kofleriaceae bacterium]|nr:phosphodiester glycosidase family protein [Kofleriaceae bacterium]
MRPAVVLALLGWLGAPAQAATLETSSTPYPGVVYARWAEAGIPARIHLLAVDLTSSELTLLATSEPQRGTKPSQFAGAVGAQIAVNGDFFAPVDYRPAGLAMGGATLWAGSADDALSGFFRFDRNGDVSHGEFSPPEEVVAGGDLAAGTQGVVGGRPMLVRAGVAQSAFDCDDQIAMPCVRAPRTALALSADGNTLWIAVVDGWQAGSLGMTAAELGNFLRARGARDALMLDGGAASAMWVAGMGGLVSSPSDGVERTVANHLAVRYGALPPGQLVGFI